SGGACFGPSARPERSAFSPPTAIATRWCAGCARRAWTRRRSVSPLRRSTPKEHETVRPALRRARRDQLDEREGRRDAGILRGGAAGGRGVGALLPHRAAAEAAERAAPAPGGGPRG